MNALFQSLTESDDYNPNALSVDKARDVVATLVTPVQGRERVFVRDALGRVLAEDIVSPIDVPAHDNSAMDGYAVRCVDLSRAGETSLKVVGTAYAGRPYIGDVPPGACIRIMTGAIVPKGMDAIAIQETVRLDGDNAVIPAGIVLGQHVRRAGEDLRAGQPALVAGKLLRPADIGLAASLGIVDVVVCRRPRVAVFSTGDELRSIGQAAKPGEIYDSNRYTLWSMLQRIGCEVIDMGVVPDDPIALETALSAAAHQADVIITSGGVSVGEADFIRELMARLGEVAFWKIAMKPGRPMAFGRIGDAWLFGLPGNPVAVMVTFYQFVRPALLKIAGVDTPPVVPTFTARCEESIRKGKGRTEFVRGIMSCTQGAWRVRPTGAQGSGILRSMAEANCFIVLESERGDISVGEGVTVQPFEGLI